MTIMCSNDKLSSIISWVGCLLKDSDPIILFAENSQILLKISVIPILVQLNSSLWHMIVTIKIKRDFETWLFFNHCRRLGLKQSLLELVHIKCQFGCGILQMMDPKMQDFCPRINRLKGNCFKTILLSIMVHQKSMKFLQKNKSYKNINFGDNFL